MTRDRPPRKQIYRWPEPKPPVVSSADYFRRKRNPRKRCRKCLETFENTDKFFARGQGGVITSTCLKCYDPTTSAWARGRIKMETCPICGERGKLVTDKTIAFEPRVCRRCLMAASLVASIGHDDGIKKWLEYFHWRQNAADAVKDP